MAGTRFGTILALAASALTASPAGAEVLDFTPDYLKVDVKTDANTQVREARFNSGLGLDFNSKLLRVSFNYKLQAKARDKADNATLSQRFGASLRSDTLNRLFGLKADLRADGTVKQGGGGFSYSVASGLSKDISNLAKLNLQYKYLLDQASAKATQKQKTIYRMGLSGKARDGRLTWKGRYGTTDVFGGAMQLQSTELLEFESRYQLAPELRFELSGRDRHETKYHAGLEHGLVNETRFGAGLAWSPSQYYSVGLKLNRRSESRLDDADFFGSGVISWFPNEDMEFNLSYGDRLIEGSPALMLDTRIDLSGS